jgi:CheY-like chemotaxis protein
MRIRIVGRPHGRADGISLDRFEPGFIYDVGPHIGNLLLAEGWAEPIDDQRPAMVIPLPDDKAQSLILVIDDDRATRAMLATMLTMRGYAVRSARDGQEGLKLLQEHPPQLILLDLKMPRMSGAEFRAAQQRLPTDLARIPVVIISGVPGAESERERLRAVDFIAKPIKDSALLEAVRSVCGTPSIS